MNSKEENNVYNLFKSIGYSDEKCQEVAKLLSDDDLEYISGGKCELRKELIKKMLALGLTATATIPPISFSNTFATDSKTLELKLDTKNINNSVDKNTDLKINNLNNTKTKQYSNNNTTEPKNLENSDKKTDDNYVSINNDNKNLAIKYYNNNRLQTAKKVAIATSTVGIPMLLLWGYNKLGKTSDNKTTSEKFNYKDAKAINFYAERLTAVSKEIYEIFNNSDRCKSIAKLYNDEYGCAFDISNKNTTSQLNVSTQITSQNNLNIFANLFYAMIFSWNSLHASQENFSSDILFNIENRSVSFKDFIYHIMQFELGGSSSNELRDFYKIIKNMQNIKYDKYGLYGFRKTIIDFKFIFYDPKTTSFENIANDGNEQEEVTDNEFDSEWKNLLNDFKDYCSQVCKYIAPGLELYSVSNDSTINSTDVVDISSKIDEFSEKFYEFSDSENWSGFLGRTYKILDENAKKKLDDCKNSYKELKKLINLDYISDENIADEPYGFWSYLKKKCIPIITSIKETLNLYKDIYNFSGSFDKVDRYYGISYSGRSLKVLFNKMWDCTKKLHDIGYKNSVQFKEITHARLDLNRRFDKLMKR